MADGGPIAACESCRTELVGWRIEVTLPSFLLEQADDAHVMWHLSQERQEELDRRE